MSGSLGAGEAGAFPGIARATYSWVPMQERGLVQGINLSGSRVGGAIALWILPVMIDCLGWRMSFVVLMLVGFAWAVFWYLFPHLKEKYSLEAFEAGVYSSVPLICGALGNWFAGWLVDRIYRSGRWTLSRRAPAILGFALAAGGVIGSVYADSALSSAIWFGIAIFGADMTLSPSWSFCIDIGKQHAGVVSGTMNMAGNVGSFITALAFPYLAAWTGSYTPFFFVAAGLNAMAIVVWLIADPRRSLEGVE